MTDGWAQRLTRWTEAGVVDAATAARIRLYEAQHAGASRLEWPVWLALIFGGLMLGAGVLLFVAAHWDGLSPRARFTLVTLLVAVFHVGGATTAERFPGMAAALHTIGTASLGAGIFLAGQIFNLDEHWPDGLMLWALGAAIAWMLLRAWPQLALAAVVAPAWLASEWVVATGSGFFPGGRHVVASGTFLLALTYFTALRDGSAGNNRRTLFVLGGIALLPAALSLAFSSERLAPVISSTPLPAGLLVAGWSVALGVPLMLALILRRSAAWPNLLATGWVLALVNFRPITGDVFAYAWWALGATALAAWGVREARSERINMAAVIFAFTVLGFYFSQVMDKLERSASLIGLGVLFLTGGWALERVRRALVLQTRGGQL